jgi:hypothetical protein
MASGTRSLFRGVIVRIVGGVYYRIDVGLDFTDGTTLVIGQTEFSPHRWHFRASRAHMAHGFTLSFTGCGVVFLGQMK